MKFPKKTKQRLKTHQSRFSSKGNRMIHKLDKKSKYLSEKKSRFKNRLQTHKNKLSDRYSRLKGKMDENKQKLFGKKSSGTNSNNKGVNKSNSGTNSNSGNSGNSGTFVHIHKHGYKHIHESLPKGYAANGNAANGNAANGNTSNGNAATAVIDNNMNNYNSNLTNPNSINNNISMFKETRTCDLFNKLNLRKDSRKKLMAVYLQNHNGMEEYYNKYLECLDKQLEKDTNRLDYLGDPKFNSGLSPQQKKLNEMKLRRTIRKNKKKLRKICTRTEKIFCEKNKTPKETIKVGVDVCQKHKMCMGMNVSIGDIPRNSKRFMKDISGALLGSLIKKNS